MHRQFRQVDVFTEVPFLGNPVAVVHGADGLADEDMQRCARWTNLSETAFLLSRTDDRADYRVRIFTPDGELPFAGHPTLGSAHAWLEAGGPASRQDLIVQECEAGLVQVRRTPTGLAFKAPPLLRNVRPAESMIDEMAASLGIERGEIIDAHVVDNGPGWVAAQLASADAVLGIKPRGVQFKLGVIGAYPAGSPEAFEVRALLPLLGDIREDPATGSLNAGLAQWLLSSGKATAPFTVSQGTAVGRRGRIHVSVDTLGSVWVGGGTHTLVSGSIHL